MMPNKPSSAWWWLVLTVVVVALVAGGVTIVFSRLSPPGEKIEENSGEESSPPSESNPVEEGSPELGTLPTCRPTGCSSQVCADKDIVTDCMYREEYACYKDAVCERGGNGVCSWRETDSLRACLLGKSTLQPITTNQEAATISF